MCVSIFFGRILFIQEKSQKTKKFSNHTQEGYGQGEVSVHPGPTSCPCGFCSNEVCGVMAPKINVVCVEEGKKRGRKQWGVFGERYRQNQHWEHHRWEVIFIAAQNEL